MHPRAERSPRGIGQQLSNCYALIGVGARLAALMIVGWKCGRIICVGLTTSVSLPLVPESDGVADIAGCLKRARLGR
jgi:hypothetical protein